MTVKRAVCWLSAVAGLFLSFLYFTLFVIIADFFVVAIDYLFYIWQTAVAKFQCVNIEDLVEWVTSGEALFHNFDEGFADAGFYVT